MRPIVKIGDRVRFRTDCARNQNPCDTKTYIVTDIDKNGSPRVNGKFWTHQNDLDICNDFSDIQVGDEVEIKWEDTITREIVKVVLSYEFLIQPDERWCYTAFQKTGKHEFLDIECLRITKKAEQKPKAEQKCSHCNGTGLKPKLKFADINVGQYVEHLNGSQLKVVSVNPKGQYASFKCSNGNTYKIHNGTCIVDSDVIVRILKPEEVVLDFGNGIKGTITRCVTYSGNGIENPSIKVSNNGIGIANILLHTITEPMRTTVLELLKAQEEEK